MFGWLSVAAVLAIWQLAATADVPPMSNDHANQLATADDSEHRDHQEPAFAALLAHIATWQSGDVGDEPIRLNIEVESMLTDPDQFRGDLCLIRGRIEQVEQLRPPYAEVDAWFVRLGSGEPVLVYVDFRQDEVSASSINPNDFERGMHVEVATRFYKRYAFETVGRDGRMRAYAAFVGKWPKRLHSGASDSGGNIDAGVAMFLLVAALGVVFFVVMVVARRSQRKASDCGRVALLREDDVVGLDEDIADLPDDPADALRVLKSRAGDDMSESTR